MRRIEHVRKPRAFSCQPRSVAEAVGALAQITRERRRLEQERLAWEKRIGRIDAELKQIAATEARLLPFIQCSAPAAALPDKAAAAAAQQRARALPPGFSEVVVRY